MFAQLITLLAVANVALSAKNLRQEPIAAAIPVDDNRAAAVLQTMMHQRESTQKNDASFVSKQIAAAATKGKPAKKTIAKSAQAADICEDGWTIHDGKCYNFGAPDSTFDGCSAFCANQGAKMACIENSSENDYLVDIKGAIPSNFWVPYDDRASEGNFVWQQGCPSTFVNWNGDEPNNDGDEDCVVAAYVTYHWHDVSCDQPNGCVCEKAATDPTQLTDPTAFPTESPTTNPTELSQPPGEQWKVVTDGYYITRHRPNSDCSGVPTMVTARRVVNDCMWDGPNQSVQVGCKNADGQVSMVTGFFENANCAGMPYYVSEYNGGDQCQFNWMSMGGYWSPLDMINLQCSPEPTHALKDGGLLHLTYDAPNEVCQGLPKTYTLEKFGSCQLRFEYDNQYQSYNEHTRYSYVTMDSCTDDGHIVMTGHSDSTCLRPIWRGRANAAAQYSDFNQCVIDGSQYTTTVCRGPGAF